MCSDNGAAYCHRCFYPRIGGEMLEYPSQVHEKSAEEIVNEIHEKVLVLSKDENLIVRDLLLREITRHIESDVGFMKLYTPIYLAIVRKLEGVI